jgi:hypothetical protein
MRRLRRSSAPNSAHEQVRKSSTHTKRRDRTCKCVVCHSSPWEVGAALRVDVSGEPRVRRAAIGAERPDVGAFPARAWQQQTPSDSPAVPAKRQLAVVAAFGSAILRPALASVVRALSFHDAGRPLRQVLLSPRFGGGHHRPAALVISFLKAVNAPAVPGRGQHHHPRPPARCRRQKGGPEDQALGRSRGGLSTKIHLAVRGLGAPVRFALTGGQRGDCPQAYALIDGLPAEVVMADAA